MSSRGEEKTEVINYLLGGRFYLVSGKVGIARIKHVTVKLVVTQAAQASYLCIWDFVWEENIAFFNFFKEQCPCTGDYTGSSER